MKERVENISIFLAQSAIFFIFEADFLCNFGRRHYEKYLREIFKLNGCGDIVYFHNDLVAILFC